MGLKFAAMAGTFAAVLAPLGSASRVAAQPSAPLRAGAARIEVTPNVADLPAPFTTVHDPLFVRAVVFDDGRERAAIVILDGSTIAPNVLTSLRQSIADELHAPAGNVILGTTHDHSAVRIDPVEKGIALPGSPKIAQMVMPRILQAVKQAEAQLQPVRIGYADGTTQLVERRVRPPGTVASGDENLPDKGPPNRTIGVLRVDGLSGQPIAFIFNSGLEPVLGTVAHNEIGGDIAGATERYIEKRYADKTIALYTVGALANTPYNAQKQGPQSPADPHMLIDAMGTILGEDVLAAAAWIKPIDDARIGGALKTIQCPGKITTPLNTLKLCPPDATGHSQCVFTTKDGPPASLEIGVLKIGPVTFVQSDADVATGIWRKVGANGDSAFVSTAYGPTHYVIEDADYASNSYPATATMAKPGCAAQGFVAAATELLRQTR